MPLNDKDFLNSVNKTLQDFLQNKTSEDIINNVYVAFGFEEVDDILNKIHENIIENRPIIHVKLENTNILNKELLANNSWVEDSLFNYTLYTIVDEDYSDNRFIVNEITSKLKHKFDRKAKFIDEYRKTNLSHMSNTIKNESKRIKVGVNNLQIEVRKNI
mgnify:CR=1 FL=1